MINALNIQREALIAASIPFVLEHGWCEKALFETSVYLNKDPAYWGMFFPDISAAVEFFERSEDARMLCEMCKLGEIDGIRNKIGKALFERIVNISGGAPMLKRLEGFYFGVRAPSAVKSIWNTADVIWLFAGDKATDFNHYSKRTLLSGVYVAVVKRMLRNGEMDIQRYIVDTLDKVVKFGNVKKYLKLPKMEDIPILRMFC